MGKGEQLPTLNVRPISGERLRYYVQSNSEDDALHVVDLSENKGNGECSCQDFTFRRQPNFKKNGGKIVEHGSTSSTRCRHINAAVLYYANHKLREEHLDLHRPKVTKIKEAEDGFPF